MWATPRRKEGGTKFACLRRTFFQPSTYGGDPPSIIGIKWRLKSKVGRFYEWKGDRQDGI